MAFVVRTTGDPYALVPSICAAVARLDPLQPVAGLRTMDEHLSRSIARPRFMSTLTTAFGALALVLAAIGIYGSMAHTVTQRTREIAIRSALGARRGALMRLVLGKGLALAAAGVTIGIVAALLVTRLLAGLLFGVVASDPSTYATVALLLVFVTLAASFIPARRATSIDPTQALRAE
jgi:ABC-type antimicrobial peptide transport system permease subunit